MKEKGFIFLPNHFDAFTVEEAIQQLQVRFVRWSDVSRSVQEFSEQTTLASLQNHLNEYPVESLIVVLPPTSVSLLDVEVPTKNVRQLKQALPFIVEEQTAQEPDNLLLVSDYKAASGTLAVTAVATELLDATLRLFKAAEFEVAELYSIEQLLPALHQQLLIIVDGDTTYLSSSDQKPISLSTGQLTWLLKKYIASNDQGLLNLKLVVTDKTAASYSEIQAQIQTQLPNELATEFYPEKVSSLETYLAAFTTNIQEHSKYAQSLLFGRYKPQKKSNQWLSLLAPTLVFASFVLCSHLALTLYSGWQYQQKANALQTEIYAAVKRAIPAAQLKYLNSDAKIRSRITQELRKSGNTEDSQTLDKIAADLIAALQSFSTDKPYLQRVSYRSVTGETQVEMHANSFAQVDQFKEHLTKTGYLVTVGSVTNDNGLFKGRLILQVEEG